MAGIGEAPAPGAPGVLEEEEEEDEGVVMTVPLDTTTQRREQIHSGRINEPRAIR